MPSRLQELEAFVDLVLKEDGKTPDTWCNCYIDTEARRLRDARKGDSVNATNKV